MDTPEPPKRALILAGGGMKVAFQAGVLQVLLDEAGMTFDHVDGASGGTFNLAMLCQGLSGHRIADNWRQMRPLRIVQPNLTSSGTSLARLERLANGVFPTWGLDFNAIQSSKLSATFNVYDFTRNELVVLEPADMTPELLLACVSLPMWFPAVRRAGDILIDSVYLTDANLDEAIARGADELWVIWTVSRRAKWRRGFINQYFQTIETVANGHFKRTFERIERSNAALAAGRHSEFERPISVRVLYGEVPLHYLVNFSSIMFRQAVDRGVQAGRAWCREAGIAFEPLPSAPKGVRRVRFTEEMAGAIGLGEDRPANGEARGVEEGTRLTVHLDIETDDLDGMLHEPAHEAQARGWVECAVLGGRQAIEDGWFNLFIRGADGTREMRYRLFFRTADGQQLTLTGVKYLRDDPGFDAWKDATTLYVQLRRGFIGPDGDGPVIAAGIIKISALAFARQLTTFRGTGPGPLGDLRSVARFETSFVANLLGAYRSREGAPRTSTPPPVSTSGWRLTDARSGVVLRTTGEGAPVFVVPGLEGSGESCLRLAAAVIGGGPEEEERCRPVLVDYSGEQLGEFDALVDTVARLIADHANGTFDLWCQSFGTVLGASALIRAGLTPRRLLLGSAFRTLPAWKLALLPPLLRATPDVVYRASRGSLSRWEFGPVGDNDHHEFFGALEGLSKADLGRRLGWLRGRDFEPQFRSLRFERGSVWLGEADRLEHVKRELEFFRGLETDRGPQVFVIPGCGHVVLPPQAIAETVDRMTRWFWHAEQLA
jgi:predicted acylesterase/phospholipase RssA